MSAALRAQYVDKLAHAKAASCLRYRGHGIAVVMLKPPGGRASIAIMEGTLK